MPHQFDKHNTKLAGLILFCSLLAGISSLTNPAGAAETISAKTDTLIKQGIILSIEQSYADAEAIFVAMKRHAPESPAGYFFHAAVLQTRMMDVERYDQEKRFLALVDKTIRLARKQIKKDKRDAWAHFFLGGGYGYLAFYQAKQKKYWNAFQNAQKSVGALEKAVKIDSTLYDAYLGIGSYKYYRSKLSRHLSWLPFVKDERAEGIAMIKLAMTKSRYSRYSAVNGVSWIFVDEARYDEGLQLVESVLADFPDSRVFLWCAAKITKKMQRWQEAADYYERILQSFEQQGILSPYNELTCRKNLAMLYRRLEEVEKAEAECAKVSAILADKEIQKKYPQALKEIQQNCAHGSAELAGAE